MLRLDLNLFHNHFKFKFVSLLFTKFNPKPFVCSWLVWDMGPQQTLKEKHELCGVVCFR